MPWLKKWVAAHTRALKQTLLKAARDDSGCKPLQKLFHWLLPFTCLLCRQPANHAQDICFSCLSSLPIYPSGCKRCARIIPYSSPNLICGVCQREAPPFDETFVLYVYEAPIVKLILDLKFQQALMNAQLLGELLAEKAGKEWYLDRTLPDVIIPMPLHVQRLQERGFNQAIELARPVSARLNIPLLLDVYQRIKATAPQATLSAELRLPNLRNAFAATEKISWQHVAVLDDVITTGSTVLAFCHLLKKQGVKKIDVWCCARPLLEKNEKLLS